MSKIKKGYKDTEIGIIPEDWDIINIGEVAEIISGGTPSSYNPKYWNGDILWCTPTDITKNKSKFISDTEKKITELGLKNSSATILPSGTILLCSRATIGEVAIAKKIITTNQGFKSLICHKEYNNEYIYYWIPLLKSKMIEKSFGSTFLEISKKNLSTINIAIPPIIEEQNAIAEALSDIDTLINALNKQIEKKKNIKQGAIQELLTGKKRLQGFTGEWKEKELGDITQIFRGGSPRPITSYITTDQNAINWIKIGDNEVSAKYITQTNEKIKPEGIHFSRFVRKGDLLLSNSMSYGRPYILDIDGCIHDGWLVLQDYQNIITVDFLYYLLGSKTTLLQYKSLAAGSSVLNLNKEIVSKVILCYPPTKEEQTAIAQILTDMDNEIEQLEKKRDKYLNIKSGMMQQLLTGQIRLTNTVSCSKSKEIKIENQSSNKKKHSKQFDEAVIISFLVDEFGTAEAPLSRFMYTKLSYLIHRKHDCKVVDFKKFAAGPYNPKSRYGGPESIGKKNQYFDLVKDSKGYDAFAPMENIQEAVDYFIQWYGLDIPNWIEQFRQYKPWDLETLATVDMAVCDLEEKNIPVNVGNIKNYLTSIPKWTAKLNKPHFSDRYIQHAIDESIRLFKI